MVFSLKSPLVRHHMHRLVQILSLMVLLLPLHLVHVIHVGQGPASTRHTNLTHRHRLSHHVLLVRHLIIIKPLLLQISWGVGLWDVSDVHHVISICVGNRLIKESTILLINRHIHRLIKLLSRSPSSTVVLGVVVINIYHIVILGRWRNQILLSDS